MKAMKAGKEGKRYRGRARVEFLACQPDILDMRDKGYSVRMVYDALREKGKVSVGYAQFCRYVSGKPSRKPAAVKPEGLALSANTALEASAALPALPVASTSVPTKTLAITDGQQGGATPPASTASGEAVAAVAAAGEDPVFKPQLFQWKNAKDNTKDNTKDNKES